jgi:MFS family permease
VRARSSLAICPRESWRPATRPGCFGRSRTDLRIARRLALGRLISLTGGSAAYIALIAAVYGETGSAAWVSAALFAGVIGTVVAAPFSGWLGDRYDRRLVLIAADLAAAAVSTTMALTGEPEALVVLLGLSAVAQSPFEPASAAAIPNLVEPADVPRANSLVAATGSAGYLVGPLLGGVVLGLGASPAALFAVDAATFVASAVLIASVRRPFGSGATDEHPGLLAGVRVIVHARSLRLLVGAGMASLVGIGIVHVASYPLSLELGAGTEGYGAMTALVGGGGVLGSILAARVLAFGPERILVAAFVAQAAGLGLSGASPVIALALTGMALAGAGGGIGDVATTTLLQSRSRNEVRSRVFAAQDGAAHVAYSVAALAGGLLVELVSARGAFACAAGCAAAAALVAARLSTGTKAVDNPVEKI